MNNKNHPKLEAALMRLGEDEFNRQAELLLVNNPKCRIVLGLLGGPSTGRYGFSHTAGKKYPRPAVRYVRDKGIVGIRKHSGPYLYITI
jgi:hypothetical protein